MTERPGVSLEGAVLCVFFFVWVKHSSHDRDIKAELQMTASEAATRPSDVANTGSGTQSTKPVQCTRDPA